MAKIHYQPKRVKDAEDGLWRRDAAMDRARRDRETYRRTRGNVHLTNCRIAVANAREWNHLAVRAARKGA